MPYYFRYLITVFTFTFPNRHGLVDIRKDLTNDTDQVFRIKEH